MKKERVIIRNDKNEKLVGYLYKNSSKTVLIFCHGAAKINGYPGAEDVFDFYYQTGTSVFSFDFTGYGESEGKNEISITQRVTDIGRIVDYFSHKYKKIILYGVSFGGISVTIASTKYKKIDKLIVLNGFFSLNPRKLYPKQALSLGLYILARPAIWPEVAYLLHNVSAKRVSVPTLILYGESDKDVKPIQSINFFNELGTEKKLLNIPGGDHTLMDKAKWKYLGPVLKWIKDDVFY